MSNFRDFSFVEAAPISDGKRIESDRGDRRSQLAAESYAPEEAGNLGTTSWRSIPLWVSNDRAEAYFEIYQVMPAHLLTNHPGPGEWHWRFCTPDGQVRARGGGYTTAIDCRDSVDALRRAAGGARVRQMGEG